MRKGESCEDVKGEYENFEGDGEMMGDICEQFKSQSYRSRVAIVIIGLSLGCLCANLVIRGASENFI